ncbi:MAG TPA: tripartite tricarboxylate transporter TctB family protein [Chloroflexota bacterium]
MRTLKAADLTVGVFMTLLAILTLSQAVQIKAQAGDRLSPATMPIVVGCMILAAGIAQVVVAWRYNGEEKIVAWPDRVGGRRVLINIGIMIVYLALLEPLGFPLATLVYITAGTFYLGRYRWWVAPLTGLLSSLTVLLVFIDFLGLSFPIGPLDLFF